ncbi:hypothetical protein DTO280E4_7821 [Paecilomyces variotii]|nr:hypothetical protein DTO217A2_2265 [Paecilomyces variotii]KAJ9352482.1 hypothetical protein DTO280E4_7821 [Paecilomyces variotii]KAJ9358345.1 hypothetical protein DTO027B9_2536 [Paecilomyces variotii]
MSLNGLDDPAVIEAYQTALTEAGGWLLLKYVGRDEISLLGRGSGGVTEIRGIMEGYEENSPLYGFLQYRRRKVILRYMPEGMSRLLQARTTVQFQSFLDKFSPHDTVFALAAASELTESALSSACLLHAASGSMPSSTSSLRHRRLMEITEDAEENGINKEEASTQSDDTAAEKRSLYSQQSEATAVPPRIADGSPQADHTSPGSKADEGHRRPSVASEHHSERSLPQRHLLEQLSEHNYEPRQSSQSTRPSFQDLDSGLYRPKVKLGPRPSMDVNGRPRTAGTLSRERDTRPVAALPAGVRPSSVRRTNAPRPKSQPGSTSMLSTSAHGGVPAVPPLLVPPPSLNIARPQLSPGARSLTGSTSSGIAPEKERLMKALELRKKQMEKRAQDKKKEKPQDPKINSVFDATEDKENIDTMQVKELQSHEKQPAESDSLPRKEPLSESGHVTSLSEKEPQTVTKPASPSTSNPDSAVDIVVGRAEDGQPSNPTTPVPPATSSLVADESHLATPQATKDVDTTEETPKPTATGLGLLVTDDHISGGVNGSETPKTEVSESSTGGDQSSTPTPDAIPPSQAASSVDDDASQTTDSEVPGPKIKKKDLLHPIHVVSAQEFSDDDNLLSDDSFMEELKSATVQEAQPISVGKSSPAAPMVSPNRLALDAPRAVSNPSALGQTSSDIQALPVGRSISSSYFENNQPPPQVLVAKKVNVSSGISKRIKALEKFSNSGGPTTVQPVGPAHSTSAFEKFRKRASFSVAGHSPASTTTSTPHTKSPAYLTPSPSPEPTKAHTLSQSSPPNASRGKPPSVSVTARIVRDPSVPPADPAADPSEPSALNLQRSPLIVESEATDSTRPSSPLQVPAADGKSEERRMSVSSVSSRGDSNAVAATRSASVASASSRVTPDTGSSPDSKKESRTSRLMRRMSSMTSNSRKSVMNALSPPLKEEAQGPPKKDDDLPPVPPQVVDIGEVNVQFPDTLLWKRRFMRIDEQGYLVLTPGNVDSSTRNIIKRYHLSEFNKPYLPDQDIQELPNSIVLDFRNGSSLQCACESRQGQVAVLQTLADAHSAYQNSSA